MSGLRRTLPFALDALAIVVFAALGRRTHEEGAGPGDIVVTAAPFLIGYAIAAAALRLDRQPLAPRRAAMVAVAGTAIGLLLRRLVFDRGTAPAFVVVAFVTITALVAGWRLVAMAIDRSRRTPA